LTVTTTAEVTIKRETRVRYADVPKSLVDERLAEVSWQFTSDEFLRRAKGEHFFHYRRGAGITVERGPETDPRDEQLWLYGSVYAAVASLNGLVPIHASAIAHAGGVYAFTGPSGAGKSTLIAALGGRGFPLFSDDTLILDLSDPDQILCLPGHKRLKLTREALELTGAKPEEKVSPTIDKFFSHPVSGTVGTALRLAELVFLVEAPEPSISPIDGSEKFVRLQDNHYTFELLAGARQFDRVAQFSHFSRLARDIRMLRFARPWDPDCFSDGVTLLARHILNADEGA